MSWMLAEILQFLQERAVEALGKTSVSHWLHREPHIQSCRGVPMEGRR
jgi:hypothetical protein